MKKVKHVFAVCMAVCFAILVPFMLQAAEQGLVINEVMASNATTIADEDGDFEDWVELYNAGSETVNLFGWGLSDDYGNPFRWVFPDVSVQPGEFLLVWASGKNRSNTNNPLHTNFSISQAGEEVLITRPDGTRQDELAPIPIPTDISYGRKPDGANAWYFFSEPTPGNANITTAYIGFSAPPEIAINHLIDRKFSVEITHNDNDAIIYYTTDCTEADVHSLVYDEPFHFQSPPDSLMYIRTTPVEAAQNGFGWISPNGQFVPGIVIRAMAVQDSLIPSPVVTRSGIAATYDIPIVAVTSDPARLFSDSTGIYVPGDIYNELGWNHDDWWGFPYANYHQRGDEWERLGNIEFIYPDNSYHSQAVGLRIHGGGSRTMPLKSFRVYARNQYGNDIIDFDVFGKLTSGYRRLLLRNSGQDFMTTMFRDVAIHAISEGLNFDTQDYLQAVSFVNGEYWGLINIRERYDKHYLERVYDIDPENIDLLSRKDEVKEGDFLHYEATLNYIEENGLAQQVHYDYVKTRIDIENFVDYKIAQIFAANTDWPHSNIDFWRLRTTNYLPDAPYGHDGRWRWLMYDVDFGYGFLSSSDYLHNTLEYATADDGPYKANPPWSTFLLRSLLENEDFRELFINRFLDLLNTSFQEERTDRIILSMKDRILPEIENHINRWGHPRDLAMWQKKVGDMLHFVARRPAVQRKQIIDFFDLNDKLFILNVDVNNQLKGHIKVNTIDIKGDTPGICQFPYPWKGLYVNDHPVTIEAIPAPGYKFSHWEGSYEGMSSRITLNQHKNTYLKAYFVRTDDEVLIHYWHFDTSMPNDAPLESLSSFYSIIPGGAEIEYVSSLEGYPYYPDHPNWRKASMERRNQPTPINYRPEGNNELPYGNSNMRGMQIRQPFVDADRENTLILHAPTTGFSDIVLRFAAKDEGAADYLIVDYAVSAAADDWTNTGIDEHVLPLSSWYKLFELDFSNVPGVANNPDLRLRIRFGGDNMSQDDGNRVTFNSISLDGVVLDAFNIYASAGRNGQINPSGNIPVYHYANMDFQIVPKKNHRIADVTVDDECVLDLLAFEGDTAFYSFHDVTTDHHIHVSFVLDAVFFDETDNRLVIYPNPADQILFVASLDAIESVEISNIAGSLIYSSDLPLVNEYELHTSHLHNGVYIIIVRTNQGVVARKFFVLR